MDTEQSVAAPSACRPQGRLAPTIRGKKVDQALNILTFSNKRIAGIVKKALESRDRECREQRRTIADIDDLKVTRRSMSSARRTLRSVSPDAPGRGNPHQQATCHIEARPRQAEDNA